MPVDARATAFALEPSVDVHTKLSDAIRRVARVTAAAEHGHATKHDRAAAVRECAALWHEKQQRCRRTDLGEQNERTRRNR